MTADTEALRAQFEAWATAAYRLSFDDDTPLKRYLWTAYQAAHAAAKAEIATAGEPVAWRDVVGFEAAYEVSDRGDVRRKGSGKVLANGLMGAGYVKADLWMNGRVTQVAVHRLVALAFLDNPNQGEQVNHINGIKTDNRLVNLEWVSKSENERHSRYSLGNLCKPVVATKIETGEEVIFPSIATASKLTGVSRSAVGRCIESPGRASHGWVFRFAETFTAEQLAAAVDAEREKCAGIVNELRMECARRNMPESATMLWHAEDALRAGAKVVNSD